MLSLRLSDGTEIGPPSTSEPGAPLFATDEVPRLIARLEAWGSDPYVRDGLRVLAAGLRGGTNARPSDDGAQLRRVAEALRNGELVWIRPVPRVGSPLPPAAAAPKATSPPPAKTAAAKEETVEQRAERRAKEDAAAFPKRDRPAASGVAIDRNRNTEYKGNSGPPHPTEEEMHPLLRERRAKALELQKSDASRPQRDPAFCAEFKAANKALLAGVKLEELVFYTVTPRTLQAKPRCQNCLVTLEGAGILSDG